MNAFPIFDPTCGQVVEWGLTKRELFAAMAMQGMLAQVDAESSPHTWDVVPETAAAGAVRCADALLAELAKPQEITP